nr:retrovirus-related Pol polyprotein from transposon TNT 1-94 [Tanacetum cinerariifolium]
PQLKSNPQGDRVMHKNSQGKKKEAEDHHRSVKLSKTKTSVTACNDSLNAKTMNVKYVSAMCDKCVLIEKHDMYVFKSADKPLKKTIASESNNKPRNFTRKLYERVSKTCSWWYTKFTPSGYIWKPKSKKEIVNSNVSMPQGKASRTANVMDTITSRRSIVSNTPLSSNSFTTHRDCPIHRSRGIDLYSITLQDTNSTNPICLMAKATSSQAWLWHRRLSHLNFDTINLLSKNDIVTLHAYFAIEGIQHQTSIARTPEQNGVVERRNRTLVEAARTMLSAAKVPLFFWAEAITSACFTQNRSLVIPHHEKTPYHIINDRKPLVKFFHIFGSVCYIVRDGENLDKIKEKGDECIFVGYSNQSRAYRVFNKRTRVIMESIHVNFDELPQMASVQNSSDPVPKCQTMALEHDSLSPGHKCQENVSHGDKTVTTLNELDLLFSPMFDELLNGPSEIVSKSSAITTADESIQRQQQQTTPLKNHTTPAPSCQIPTLATTVTSSENINQAETHTENDQVTNDEFINIFLTPVQDQRETSSRHIDSSNMHTFYQRYPSEHRWTKDHPLEQVIGNPSQSVRTR